MKDPGFRKAYKALRSEYEQRRQEIIANLFEGVGIVAKRIDADPEEIGRDVRGAIERMREEGKL